MTDFQSGRRKKGWMNLRVQEVIHETHDTDTFVLVDADEGARAFDYFAGQYLTFRFDDIADKPLVRSYTMSSSPCQADFAAFTVKRVHNGLVSNWLLDNIKVGSVLKARGPIGRFIYEGDKDQKHLFMVGAGSGVTPFVSIAREYASRLGQAGAPSRMTLLVSYRSRQDLILWPDLTALRRVPGIEVITTLSREDVPEDGYWYGRIDEAMLAKAIKGSYQGTTFMTCGPVDMMNLVVRHAKSNGTPEAAIKLESFES